MLPSSISDQGRLTAPYAGVFIGLGSNLGFDTSSPRVLLLHAVETLQENGDRVDSLSSLWVSDAWPAGTGAPKFINAVCRVQPYDESPIELLKRLHAIEAKFGRQRDPHSRWSARSLDLDLLDYNGLTLKNNSFVTLPHPRIVERDFVLKPLLQICPNWCHPVTGVLGRQALAQLEASGATNNCHLADESMT
jgi:2-amino-4-hydroxy-6-hydroxymethyldihydropteridine diphosphokinase